MAETSVIGAGTIVSGHIRGEGSLEILGRVEGDVNVTGNVSIGPAGRVRGNVNGAQLTISGQVQGDLRGSQGVLLERGARVVGDISGPRVAIVAGALARGHVQTDGEPGAAAAKPRPAATNTSLRVAPLARAIPALQPRTEAKALAPPPEAQPSVARAEPRAANLAAKAPQRPELRRPDAVRANPVVEFEPVRPLRPEPRRPPPPVVPVISKGTKAKKKKSQD